MNSRGGGHAPKRTASSGATEQYDQAKGGTSAVAAAPTVLPIMDSSSTHVIPINREPWTPEEIAILEQRFEHDQSLNHPRLKEMEFWLSSIHNGRRRSSSEIEVCDKLSQLLSLTRSRVG